LIEDLIEPTVCFRRSISCADKTQQISLVAFTLKTQTAHLQSLKRIDTTAEQLTK